MSEIKVVEESEYTGKFKVGDKVRPKHYFKLGVVIGVNENDDDYPYLVEFSSGEEDVFNEAALELVNDTKNNNDKLDALRYSIDKINRPASSHYHTNNNGNDVWNFADDNLSSERVKGFHQINAIKYVSRYNKKQDTSEKRIEDLEKAKVSIDKLIELERKSMTGKGCDVGVK